MLKIENLNKSYGNRKVLQNLNLEIKAGDIYGLLGANGAGKTTTINLICNLLNPDSGLITINDQKLSHKTKKWLGVAPQQNLIYPQLTCYENLAFFGKIYGLKSNHLKTSIINTLKAVNLLDRKNSITESLSGGMQRRINMAIALVHNPKLLILDEPTTGLDIETRHEIWQLILLLKNQGMTILLTTHLLDEAQKLCDKIGIIKNGQIIAEGNIDQLKKLIKAKEIVLMQTEEEEKAIKIANKLGFTHRYYGNELAFWLSEELELKEIINLFKDISINSLARQPINLEHIYLEVTQEK